MRLNRFTGHAKNYLFIQTACASAFPHLHTPADSGQAFCTWAGMIDEHFPHPRLPKIRDRLSARMMRYDRKIEGKK